MLTILLLREKVFSSNLVTFFIKKWVTICTIKLEGRPFHAVMATAQIKGAQKLNFGKNFFSIPTSEMESATIN